MTYKSKLTLVAVAGALALSAPMAALAKGHDNGINGAGNPTLGGDTSRKGGNALADTRRTNNPFPAQED